MRLSETKLKQVALDCLRLHDTDDAWSEYCDEANARYSGEEDGPYEDYSTRCAELFNEAISDFQDETVRGLWPCELSSRAYS